MKPLGNMQGEMGSHDSKRRRKASRSGRMKGVKVFIPAEELVRAGIDPDGPPPLYRLVGRKVRGHRVIVNLYPQ